MNGKQVLHEWVEGLSEEEVQSALEELRSFKNQRGHDSRNTFESRLRRLSLRLDASIPPLNEEALHRESFYE